MIDIDQIYAACRVLQSVCKTGYREEVENILLDRLSGWFPLEVDPSLFDPIHDDLFSVASALHAFKGVN